MSEAAARSVLIVDDSVVVARQLESIIGALDRYEVAAHAKNGMECLKLYKDLQPDIVCLDLVMPQMDGLQTLRALKQIDDDVKVLVISSLGGVGDKVLEALRFGAANVISKPFEAEKILELLDSL